MRCTGTRADRKTARAAALVGPSSVRLSTLRQSSRWSLGRSYTPGSGGGGRAPLTDRADSGPKRSDASCNQCRRWFAVLSQSGSWRQTFVCGCPRGAYVRSALRCGSVQGEAQRVGCIHTYGPGSSPPGFGDQNRAHSNSRLAMQLSTATCEAAMWPERYSIR